MDDQLLTTSAGGSAAKRPRSAAAASRTESATPTSISNSSSNSSKRRRRRRRLSAGVSGAREDEDDATIVWRDSPADKQVRVSGTGKLAVRREVQGFVGRLARASVEDGGASSSAASASPDRREQLLTHAFAKRKASRAAAAAQAQASATSKFFATSAAVASRVAAVGGINRGANSAETAISRQLAFSPESALRRKTAGTPPRHSPATAAVLCDGSQQQQQQQQPNGFSKSDSQDELFLILDQIDEKYSLQDGGLPTTPTRAAAPAAPATASSDETSGSAAAMSTAQTAFQYATPEKQPAPPTGSGVVECGSPLTEESWELLDQLEFEATQRIPDSSQDAMSSQASASSSAKVDVPAPPCAALPAATNAAPPHRPPALPHTSSTTAVVENESMAAGEQQQQQQVEQEDFKRFVVLEVECDVSSQRLTLRLLDDQDVRVDAVLAGDWFDTSVEAGDTVNIVFTEKDSAGFFSQDTTHPGSRQPPAQQLIQVDNDRNVVILHPDVLVSPTTITTSLQCLRRAILRETLNVSRPTHQTAFLGTLKHELFEKALVEGEYTAAFLLQEAQRIVQDNIIGLVECGLSELTALMELRQLVSDFKIWLVDAHTGSGVSLYEPRGGAGAKVRVHKVLATEEMMWSVKWGIKGATDASVEATFSSRAAATAEKVVLPVELKTGSKKYGAMEHQGQVILYTLLLNERYRQKCQDGLVLYAPGIESNKVAAMAIHVRGLIFQRNKYASAMAKVKALGSSSSSQVFPSVLRSRSDCGRCFQVDECMLHHAAVENGTGESSGLDEDFASKVGHLREADLAYFKRWNRLIDLEQQHAEKNLRALWLQVGWKREQDAGNSTCIASLKLVRDEPVSERGTSRLLRFQRDADRAMRVASQRTGAAPLRSLLELGFRVDDRIIVSAESEDGRKLLVHVARGKVVAIDQQSIALEVRQAIPAIVTHGESSVGKRFSWRLDKDAITTGLKRAKENLARLFIGPPPELVAVGTDQDARPELKALLAPVASESPLNTGDARRRNLVVHLARPRFKSCRVSDLVTQRCKRFELTREFAERSQQGQRLLDEFFRLNIDQQRAVQKVLSSLDYALVLGMPGTGKTSTIAFAVRLLLFLGFSVLVTSYTHSAVDNLLLKVLAADLPMLRLGAPKQVHPQLVDLTLERQSVIHGVKSVRDMEALMLGAQLVGCTCLSVNSHVLFQKRRFDFCIVDEATQTTQPVVLGALRCADTFVLVGDHYQLPPLVASAQARKEGMDVSLFRHLSEAHPAAVQQLSFQYRMNADIMLLANRLVYGGKLKCGSFQVASNHLRLALDLVRNEAARKPSTCTVPWPLQALTNNRGVVFLDTDALDGTSESVVGGGSGRRRMENAVEAQLVVGLVQLLVDGGVAPEEVAVISPFRSQVALLASRMAAAAAAAASRDARARLSRVEVSTIDKYQGKDKDVVLVSFVRSNDEHRVGELLTDWRRINVALTRARQKLLLVGSLRTLSGGSPLFSVLAQTVRESRWRFELAPDALAVLERCVQDARSSGGSGTATRPLEPEPEREHDDSYAEVSVLHPSDDNDDIEGLVRNVSSVSRLPRQQQRVGPISRDAADAL